MEIDNVMIRAPAFTQMLGYAIEVYKRECTGVLMGDVFRTARKVVVNSAIALQTADRSYTGVQPKWHRYDRIAEVISFLSLDWILGEFHSHTDHRNKKPSYRLSEPDREYVLENHDVGGIEVVIALYKKKRQKKWDYTNKGRILKGTLGKYNIEIGAHFKKNENNDGTLTEVWIPITKVANIASDIGLSPLPGYIFDYIPPQLHAGRYRKLVRLIRKYENQIIKTEDPDAGEELLDRIRAMMEEIAALSKIYG